MINLRTLINNSAYRYKFRAYRSSAQGSVASGSSQDIVFNNDSTSPSGYDPENLYNTSTGEFTAPVAGWYHFYAQYLAYYSGTISPTRADIFIQVKPFGGAYGNRASNNQQTPSAVSRFTPNTELEIYLGAGDMVKVQGAIYYASGAPFVHGDGNGQYTFFQGRLLSTAPVVP